MNYMKDNLLVDTNVLIYMETADDLTKHIAAIETLTQLKSGYDLFLSIQNLNEFCNNMNKKTQIDFEKLNGFVLNYQETFRLIFFNIETIKRANQISRMYHIHFFDSLLAATMQENNINTIITENKKDFEKIPWLKVISPFQK